MLSPGQQATVEGTSVAVRFAAVVNDSRCPTDVTCVQAGEAVVRIDVLEKSAVTATVELRDTDQRPARAADLSLSLLALEPRPVSTRSIDPSSYRATLRVAR